MLFTYEEIKERKRYANFSEFSFVVIDKKQKVVFYGTYSNVIDWVKNNCYKKEITDCYYGTPTWVSRIPEWIKRSIENDQKYKGYKFHFYNKHWERKIKIAKFLNKNVIENI